MTVSPWASVLLRDPGGPLLPLHRRHECGVHPKSNPDKLKGTVSDTPGGLPAERARPVGNPSKIAVVTAHPDLREAAVEVNGHHGVLGADAWGADGHKYVVDRSGGQHGRPLVALVLPQRLLVSTDDAQPSDEVTMEPAS